MEHQFVSKIDIRFADIDMYGHVNNAVFFSYMEIARTDAMLKGGFSFEESPVQLFIVEAECKYKKPIKLDDELYIDCYFRFNENVRFSIHYIFRDENHNIYASGDTVLAVISRETGKPVRVPQELKEIMMDMRE